MRHQVRRRRTAYPCCEVQRALPLDGLYSYDVNAANVRAYVIDTGLRHTHAEFEGRVDLASSISLIADGYVTEDCHGHGTFVAAVAAGATYGVAKGARLHSVRVADCNGSASISSIMSGIDWITSLYPAPKGGKTPPGRNAVVNISLSVGASFALDDAVTRSIQNGITYVVAAGNTAGDACLNSPGRVAGAITVGAHVQWWISAIVFGSKSAS